MVRIRRRLVVLERLVVRDVVVLVTVLAVPADRDADRVHRVTQPLVRRVRRHVLAGERARELVGCEAGRRLARLSDSDLRGGERRRRREPALEPAPAEALRIELVADVGALQRHRVAGRAVVVVGLGVRDEREATLAVGDGVAVGVRVVDLETDVARVAGDEVDRPGRGRPERRAEEVVAQPEVLRVVPHPRDGVAVVVVHDGVCVAGSPFGRRGTGTGADARDELVHLAVVERLLLVVVIVVLVAGQHVVDVGRIEPARIDLGPARVLVRVVGQERPVPVQARRVVETVDLGAACTVEGLPVGVGSVRVGAEVVVE